MLALFDCFPPTLRKTLYQMPDYAREELEEIRLRAGRELQICLRSGNYFADKQGVLSSSPEGAMIVSKSCIASCMEQFTASSYYAWEHEMANGYLTLPGGHRVGFCGSCIIRDGAVTGMRDVSSVNVRAARQLKGISDELMPYLLGESGIKNTLIISPPGCGKTTLLRDIARNLSDGFGEFTGINVAVADERGEIGACYRGEVTNDLGRRTDVWDGCPKAEGMLLLLRSRGPGVLLTDEIGSRQDEEAICRALHAGVSVVASAHGRGRADVLRRLPGVGALFTLFVTLRLRDGVHEIEAVEECEH